MTDAETTAPRTGGCQCGAVRYELRSAERTLWICHCHECQKQSGSAFGMSCPWSWPT
ncbi:MAG: hypothetical protein WDM92_07580 [Caulobacteraceae bacterium]